MATKIETGVDFSFLAPLVSVCALMVYGCAAGDGSGQNDGEISIDDAIMDLPAIDGDVASEADIPPTHLAPDGQTVLPANPATDPQEKIFTAQNPDGSRSRQRGAIQINFLNGGSCSGSIVNNGIVLTAAHCLPVPNRNRLEPVEIYYQYPADPNMGFCPDCGPPELRKQFQMFFYPHPNQTRTEDIDRRWDFAVGAICSPGSPCSAGGAPTASLGLHSSHFVTLSTHVLQDNNGLTVHGYGAPEVGVQHQMGIRVDDAEADRYSWVFTSPAQWVCDGDSGGPAFRNSGYTDSMGRYWQAQAGVTTSVTNSASFGGQQCGDDGRGSNVRKKTAWVESIVDFWTSRRCQSFTNPAGEPALWCWAT